MLKKKASLIKKASVIIVSHNNREILPRALDALRNQSYKNFDIFVVDNDSNDGTEEFIKKEYPEVRFISLSEGVSKKRNHAINISDADYIITHDSDAILGEDWIKNAVEYMDFHEDAGICCGKLIGKEGKVDFAGGIMARNGGIGDRGHGKEDGEKFNHFTRMSAMTTAASIIRKKTIEDIGNFDESYYYGYEDGEFGLRANFAGWKVVYNPDLIAKHYYHSTLSKFNTKRQDYLEFLIRRNRLITMLRYFDSHTLIANFPNIFLTLLSNLREHTLPTLKAYAWTVSNPGKISKYRKETFKKKKMSDKELFEVVYFPVRFKDQEKGGFSELLERINSKKLINLTFFITTKCNSKCKHCFYWKELNQSKDLDLKEIRKIASKFFDVHAVSLSGGEPFLRKDLDKVVRSIIRYTNCKILDIPTNCLIDPTSVLESMFKENPETQFVIDCSLDGMKEEHEYIRGVKGGFEKVVMTIENLKKLKQKYPNFRAITVNTVVTDKNIARMKEFIEFVKKLEVDSHSFDIIRGEHRGICCAPKIEQIKEFNKLRCETIKSYNKKMSFLKKGFYNLKSKKIIKTQIAVIQGGKWPFKCSAGITDFVVESDGTARICELMPKIGNLLKNTPEELLKSREAREILRKINSHACDCTHICNLNASCDYFYKKSLKNFIPA